MQSAVFRLGGSAVFADFDFLTVMTALALLNEP